MKDGRHRILNTGLGAPNFPIAVCGLASIAIVPLIAAAYPIRYHPGLA